MQNLSFKVFIIIKLIERMFIIKSFVNTYKQVICSKYFKYFKFLKNLQNLQAKILNICTKKAYLFIGKLNKYNGEP
ncbi:hypothetical protein CR203_23245 [Salipaludibacillus neizhouensis]|uniref:Uncharacterized protein n=1 Tax=Salipaludibacillus neizhouensis TaxID=885475 RepID=A0A3A9K5M9_9BACI|nr:hypothetical protein CR203_23245 [Salipaludibacillus neizhouensis]